MGEVGNMTLKQKVLIVDDEPRSQRIILEILGDLAECQVASSGDDALTMAETFLPDLVLLDIMMPGMDGYEVCRRFRSNPRLSHLKIVLVSGKAMIEERLKGYEVGADDYLTKPFDGEELLAKAKVFLRLTSTELELNLVNKSLEQKVLDRTNQLLEAEARLVTSAKMSALGEMAGGIAHEINTPLATLSLIVNRLKRQVELPMFDRSDVSRMIEISEKTILRISGIIRGLSAFSRDASRDDFEMVSLSKIIESSVLLCGEAMKHNEVKMIIETIPDEVKVKCRPVQISQVIINLIGNACDAIESLPDKWIKIGIRNASGPIVLFVMDSGRGIPESIAKKIFQPFFTTKDVGKGTGLGLSISKGIMDAHGGSISVDFECENTCFLLSFP